ncbi:MAG: helix-turn-helix domain-containing protein [Eubacterium sp.]|nr:helix-turn-helix domain-containing protein [Eubacterium sp.]
MSSVAFRRELKGEHKEAAERLREVMMEQNIRPADLARKTGLTKAVIGCYLSGKSKMSPDAAQRIGVSLGVSAWWLLGEDGTKAI